MIIFFLIVFSISVMLSIYTQSIEPIIIIGVVNIFAILAFWSLTALSQSSTDIAPQTPSSTIAQLDVRSKEDLAKTDTPEQKSSLETLSLIVEHPQSNPAKSDKASIRPAKPMPSRGTSDYF